MNLFGWDYLIVTLHLTTLDLRAVSVEIPKQRGNRCNIDCSSVVINHHRESLLASHLGCAISVELHENGSLNGEESEERLRRAQKHYCCQRGSLTR